jgi:ABC-2 type transport system permease protein
MRNIFYLFRKELASMLRDPAALFLIAFSFSFAIYWVSRDINTDVANVPTAVVDHDRSPLSLRLGDALLAPQFQPPLALTTGAVDEAMDHGKVIFALSIPSRFEADLLTGRRPDLQLLVDATAMTQAGLGALDISDIVNREVADYLGRPSLAARLPVRIAPRTAFNPNHYALWFVAIMQVTMNLTILSIILVGAAFMRERERGTMDRLLVMPVSAFEIALGKIAANSLIVAAATLFAIEVVIRLALGIPVAGSVWLFMLGTVPYLFATAAIGILLATATSSMPQFSLLAIPVFVILSMLSGAITPIETMPRLMRVIMQASPTLHFAAFSEAVLFRGAGLGDIWGHLLAITAIGIGALWVALLRFRAMMAKAS